MQVTLLLGFLGAGKTTLLRKILKHGSEAERTAVIVNEFGDVGVDGEILAGRSLDTVELASGCICCSLKGPMIDAIAELQDSIAPDRLVIEASGVAQPDEIIAALSDPAIADRIDLGPIVTLVDAGRFPLMLSALGSFYEEQVVRADRVIVNKIDTVDADQAEEVQASIARLNPSARIELAERCDIDIDEVLEGASGNFPPANSEIRIHNHVNMTSFVIETPSSWKLGRLQPAFAGICGTLWRAKGFLEIDGRSHLVQFSSGRLEVEPTDDRDRHYLVFIGQGIERDQITELFT